ncbi:hypothetical protein [Caballeronia concitans]|jgi:Tfp pilus assembly protein PilF|uniref:Lipoprotein n=1 Tax=Caballeronia concitans TaxID=1777133 RepID=A0A658R452_9BURK|nr:hypothetical protein [Caballeronia concitans]KIG01682.1 hypothetical protein BurMR1_1267 [Burkholderia sp. MR1]SAL46591.1 hypothetical protein AWB72_04862 [Caballeronia concitans]
MQFRSIHVAPLLLALALGVSACKDSEKSQSTREGDVPVTVATVRTELEHKNFGQAASLADKLTASNPNDVDAWMIAADARSAVGNRIDALAALESAMNHGMRDITRLDADSYLDPLRSSSEYEALLMRFGLMRPLAKAGDTSIVETSTGTVVRAGDVSVSLPNDK